MNFLPFALLPNLIRPPTGAFTKLLAHSNESHLERIASTLNFENLDVSKIAKKLRLEKNGKSRGNEGKPATESENFDVPENEIISLIQDERKRCVEAFTRNMETYGERLRSLDFEGTLTEIKTAVRSEVVPLCWTV